MTKSTLQNLYRRTVGIVGAALLATVCLASSVGPAALPYVAA